MVRTAKNGKLRTVAQTVVITQPSAVIWCFSSADALGDETMTLMDAASVSTSERPSRLRNADHAEDARNTPQCSTESVRFTE